MDELVGSGMVLLFGLRTPVRTGELLQPIRAQQQLPPDECLTKPIRAQKAQRRQQQPPVRTIPPNAGLDTAKQKHHPTHNGAKE
ncbi:hypothetical protein [Flavitalea sp.]|nr:hypothetical protein [Flavitalea sp.]